MNFIRSIIGTIVGLIVFVIGFGIFATIGFALIGFTVLTMAGVLLCKKFGLLKTTRTEEDMRAARAAAFERFANARHKARRHANKTKESIIIEGEVVDRA